MKLVIVLIGALLLSGCAGWRYSATELTVCPVPAFVCLGGTMERIEKDK